MVEREGIKNKMRIDFLYNGLNKIILLTIVFGIIVSVDFVLLQNLVIKLYTLNMLVIGYAMFYFIIVKTEKSGVKRN